MESTELLELQKRARYGYERGRLTSGVYASLFTLPAMGFSLLTSNTPQASVAIGAALVMVVVALRWLGQAYGRAVVPGLLAGTAPLILPLLLRGTGHTCFGGVCWSTCMLGCIAGGLAAGVTVGWISARERDNRWAFLSAAMLLSVITGSLGCAVVGSAGTVGMLLAVIASSLPVSFVVQARAS